MGTGNFIWAIEQMKKNNKVRREGGTPEHKGYLLEESEGILMLRSLETDKLLPFTTASIKYIWGHYEEPKEPLWNKILTKKEEPIYKIEKDIKVALKEFLGFLNMFPSFNTIKYNEKAKEIFGEELLK